LVASGSCEALALIGGIIMNMKNWTKNTNAVLAWLEREERGDNGKAIELSIMLGNGAGNDDMRSTYWTAIRSIGSTFEDFPVARRGRESSLPEDVEQNALSVKNAVQSAFATIGSADLILQVILPHGRTGGAFADVESFAANYADKAYKALLTGYKEGRWDGSLDGDMPNMTPPAVKTAEGGQEEE